MEYVFIDYENAALRAIPDHERIGQLILFAGENQKTVSMDIAESLLRLGPKAKLVRMHGTGKNALDFHIAYHLGKLAESDPGGTFRIVSKDKGFDPLVEHLRAAGIDCSRTENLAAKAVAAADVQGMIAELLVHLREMGGKARPKKAPKLKAYIRNRCRAEDAVVDEIFAGLAAAGLFALEGSKLRYPDSR
jgi:PIN domain